ncbi:polymorphic toxin-type HINT domain-containing protein [Streptomyces hydrogenans]|uniref:polymorphic toxin-type HINT domain-containing protein n=1 Tax=Streptomyces hydrogenans TaxID=1873719 RepID=UPI00368C375F
MLALALMASGASLSPVAAQAASGGRGLPELQKVTDVPAASTTPKGPAAPPDTTAKSELKAAPGVRWPAAASAEATVPKASASGRSAAAASAAAVGPSAKAGSLPVRLALGNKAVAKGASVPAADAPAVTAKVSVHGQDKARKAGVKGVLLSVQRTDSGKGTNPLSVQLDYSAFAHAYGGDWGSRLRFSQRPACVLTTPEKPECQGSVPLASVNDTESGVLTGTFAARAADTGGAAGVSSADTAAASGAVVLAATASASGAKGTYSATSLSPTGSWSAGSSTGDFSWTYPMEIPASLGGPGPSLSIGYNSGSIDGRTVATSQQPSWVGDGWDTGSSFIERTYVACAEDRKAGSGFNNPTTHPTGDLCHGPPMVTMSLNGSSTSLVLNDADKKWYPASQDGSKVELLTGAENGDKEKEYWVVTNAEGVKFHFGLNRLPGWASGKPETNSALNVPVYGNHSGEPCYNASYAASVCDQTYRWNLDYVVDPRGNALTYWYAKERNYYGSNVTTTGTSTARAYDRAGYLKRAAYGLRSDDLFAPAPAEVTYKAEERCIVTGTFDCAEAKLTSTAAYDVAKNWPDVPADQLCASGQTCTDRYTPTFFTRKLLKSITTRVLKNGVSTAVDTWTMAHSFQSTGDGAVNGEYPLWLKSIQRTDENGGTLGLPAVTFVGVQKPNRVDNDTDGNPPYLRWRVTQINTETGARTVVVYAPTECSSTPGAVKLPASPDSNTLRCFPVVVETNDPTDPTGMKKKYSTDWFHKHRVDQVREEDKNGTSPTREVNYTYLGTPAWAYDDASELTNKPARTWSVYRGYGEVRTVHGVAPDVLTRTETLFYRGMDGDLKADGTRRNVSITASDNSTVDDHRMLAGQARETRHYNGVGGELNSATINTPYLGGPVAKRDRTATGASDLESWVQGVKSTSSRTILSDGRGERKTAVEHDYDSDGRINWTWSKGDTSTTDDDTCVRYEYLNDTEKWFKSQQSRVQTTTGACNAPIIFGPDNVISDTKVEYDAVGNVVKSSSLSGFSANIPQYTSQGTATFDAYGRLTSATDVYGKTTSTAYTPASGAVVTKTVTTNTLGHTATTEIDPGRGLPIAQTDANGRKTVMEYDALGRMKKVWSPDRDPLTTTPDAEFEYTVGRDAPVVITNKRLLEDGTYRVSYDFYDGALRLRQTQNPAMNGGRVVTDTFYDSLGRVWKENGGYYNSASGPVATLFPPTDNSVPSSTVMTYDGLGRPSATIARSKGVETWRSTTTYGGDWTAVDPPAGDTPTMALLDAQGRKTELRQFKGAGPTGDYDKITYGYDRKGRLEKVTDQVGNVWSQTYDVRGRVKSTTDPDKGTSDITYDQGDRIVSVTDGRSPRRTIAMAYDALGRVTATHEGSLSGTKLTSQTYDTIPGALGLAASSTRYVNGNAYTQAVTAYDTEYRPKSTSVTIPASEGKLAGTYTYTNTYTARTGLPQTMTHPAVGGLPSERVSIGYNALDSVNSMAVAGLTFVAATEYTSLGDVVRTKVDSAGKALITSNLFDEQTRRVTRTTNHQEVGTVDTITLNDVVTDYDVSGNVMRITDKTGDNPTAATTDVQCFAYDHLRRMTDAWTASDACALKPGATGTGSAPKVGGPDAYWHSYTFDAAGNRLSETKHDPLGDTAKDVNRTFTYATGLPTKSRLAKVTTTGPQGQREELYGYDDAGNTTTRTIQGNTQNLTWDLEGHLEKVTAGTNESSYVYDAGGNRLIKREATGTTLYLPGTELKLDAAGNVAKTTRYFAHPAGPVMVKVAEGGTIKKSYLLSDRNGTATTAVDAATKAVTRRKQTPFGEDRGTAPSMWPDDKGYLGKTKDDTGLTHIGAREYDPTLGRFISVDPLMDIAESQTMNPYAYGNNSPITFSDPSGLASCDGAGDCRAPMQTEGKDSFEQVVDDYVEYQLDIAPPAKPKSSVSEDDVKKATFIKKKSKADVILEIAIEVAKGISGFDDIQACLGGDVIACGSLALDVAVPLAGKAKRTLKALEAAWKMYHRWEDEVRWALGVMRRADDDAAAMARYAQDYASWEKKADAAKAARKADAAADAAKKSDGGGAEACPIRNSFTPETHVLLADGTSKPIKDLKPGDQVMATDEKTGETTGKNVAATIVGDGEKHLVRITVDTDGDKGTATAPITATDGHPFWVPALSKWIDAKDLKPGQWLRTSAGTHVQVTAVQAWTQTANVRNLTVADFHTYYVMAGPAPVLVHNCGTALHKATDLDLSAAALRPIPPKGNKAWNPNFHSTEAGRALQKHTDTTKRSASHVAKYVPFLRGANRKNDYAALNRGGRELLGELLGNPDAKRTFESASDFYGGLHLNVTDSVTGRGARWSMRGGGVQFEGWL